MSPRWAALLSVVALTACGGSNEPGSAGTDGGGTGGTGGVLDGGGTVDPPPNGATLCPKGACNYQTQDGCTGSQACLPAVSGSDVVPSCQGSGSAHSGEACTGWNDCAPGLFCAEGACRTLCCGGDWSACPAGESCIRQLAVKVGDAGVSSGADLCFPVNNCDPLDATACADQPGMACLVVDPTGNVACTPEGSAAAGEPCSGSVHCSRGFACVASACRRLCRAVAGGSPACTASEGACVHYNRDPAGVGECTPQ